MSRSDRAVRPTARLTRKVLAASALLATFVGTATGAEASLPGDWVEARSDHFVLVGNVGEKKARKTLQSFERMRELVRRTSPGASELDDPPLLVFAVKDARSLLTVRPSLRNHPGRDGIAGIFHDEGPLPFVVVRTDFSRDFDLAVVFHEYYHYLVDRLGVDLPPWLGEGLADFWGASVLTDKVTEIGRTQDGRLYVIRRSELLPLERFFAVQRSDPEYRQPDKVAVFYAQSWAMVHYLSMGVAESERAPQLGRYLGLLAAGRSSLDAAREAFGDLGKLEHELRVYLRQLSFPFAKQPPIETPAVDSAVVSKLAAAEAAAWIGLAQLHVDAVDDAEPWVELARSGAPDRIESMLAGALLDYRRGRWSDAAAGFDRAVERAGAPALAAYGAGASRLRGAREDAILADAERHLLRAVELDRLYAPAYAALAELYGRTDADPRRALALQSKAVAIRPQQEELQVGRIALLFAAGRADEAAAELERRIEQAAAAEDVQDLNTLCWLGSLRQMADRVLAACDRAVDLAPEERRWAVVDSRALARSLAGDLDGALSDFRSALAGAGDDWSEETAAKRRRWIEILESGRSPFEGEGLQALLDDSEENSGWGL